MHAQSTEIMECKEEKIKKKRREQLLPDVFTIFVDVGGNLDFS